MRWRPRPAAGAGAGGGGGERQQLSTIVLVAVAVAYDDSKEAGGVAVFVEACLIRPACWRWEWIDGSMNRVMD